MDQTELTPAPRVSETVITQPVAKVVTSPSQLQMLLFVILSLVAGFIAGLVFNSQYLNKKQSVVPSPTPTICTMEAKLCPDGSSVGRTGPNCEFTACPEVQTQTTNLATSYTVTLPTPMKLMVTSSHKITYGFDGVEYLAVTDQPTISLDGLLPNSKCSTSATEFCLNEGKGWGQTEDVAVTNLNGKVAKSFYISRGNDEAYHVVQTTKAPFTEFRMLVSGGGLDQRFQSFLTSLKWTSPTIR